VTSNEHPHSIRKARNLATPAAALTDASVSGTEIAALRRREADRPARDREPAFGRRDDNAQASDCDHRADVDDELATTLGTRIREYCAHELGMI
jgi:hypothetical protein